MEERIKTSFTLLTLSPCWLGTHSVERSELTATAPLTNTSWCWDHSSIQPHLEAKPSFKAYAAAVEQPLYI